MSARSLGESPCILHGTHLSTAALHISMYSQKHLETRTYLCCCIFSKFSYTLLVVSYATMHVFASGGIPYPPATVFTGGLSTPSFEESAVSAFARPGRGRRDRPPPATSFCSDGGEFGVSGDPLPPSSFPSSSSDAHLEDMLVLLTFAGCFARVVAPTHGQRERKKSPQTGRSTAGGGGTDIPANLAA